MDSISDVLSSTYTDSELKHVISVLDEEAQTASTVYTQRNIRTKVESDLFSRTRNVLNKMQPLATNLQSLGKHITNSANIYNEVSDFVSGIEASTAVYAENARFLLEELEAQSKEAAVLQSYMEAVYINDSEREIINNVGQELTADFFAVLSRIKLIHSKHALLLLAEAPSSGEHLMLETNKLLDTAYLRIKSAIESELKERTRATADTPPANLRKYMSLLADRPLLFKSVLEEQSGLRKERLAKELNLFLATEQSSARMMPVRFLGSVLAWLHAAIVNEFEHISLLLDPEAPTEDEMSTSERSLEQLLATSDTRKIITELVDSIICSVDVALRHQINSVIIAQSDAVVVNELHNLLCFYEQILRKYEQSTIKSLLDQLAENLDRQFAHLLEDYYPTWESHVDVALAVVKMDEGGVYSNKSQTANRLNVALDGILQRELESASPIHALNVLDMAVIRLAGHISAQSKLDEYRKLQADYEAKQISLEVRELKNQSRINEFQVHSLSAREFLAQFDEFLSMANIELNDRLEKLNSPTVQHRIASSALLEFIDEYEFAVKDVPNARTADEIRQLLV